ncbi:MAG: hypothetical protein C0478_08700 [Planctomyces sp.]|nr:hypothetical protein [Planctomyces sp.]
MPAPADKTSDKSMVKAVSLGVLSLFIGVFVLMFYQVMAPYLMSLLLAAILAIIAQPLHRRSLEFCRGWNSVAASVTTTGVVVVMVIPMLFAITLTGLELSVFVQDNLSDASWESAKNGFAKEVDWVVQKIVRVLPADTDPEMIKRQLLDAVQSQMKLVGSGTSQIAASTWGLIGTVLEFVVQLSVCLLGLYFFLADGPRILKNTSQLIPIQPEYQMQVFDQFTKVTRSVVLGTLLAAVGQGAAMAIAAGVLGLGHVFVFGMVTTVASMVPIVGAAGIYAPVSLLLIIQGHYAAGIGLFLFGFIVISSIDNVVRAYILSSNVQMHPLLGFVSILGGLEVFGLWGIFLGPMIASVLYALVRVFNQELRGLMSQSSRTTGNVAGDNNMMANLASDVAAAMIATPTAVVATMVEATPPAQEASKPPAC